MRSVLTAVPALFWAGPLLAHSPVPGIEGFYTGLAHPFVEPAILMAALAVTVLILLDWPRRFQRGWPLYAGALFLGLLAGRSVAAVLPLEPALLAAALLCAALAALAGDRLTAVTLIPLSLTGLLIGAAVLPEPGPTRDVVITAAGGLVGANLCLLVLGGAVDWLRQRHDGPILHIGLRVAASWLGAAALILLAFVLRPAG